MKNQYVLKSTLVISLVFIVLLFTQSTSDPEVNDGSFYQLDLGDNSTYTVDCYETLDDQNWVVKNSCCTLLTSVINLPGTFGEDPAMDVPVNVEIIATGNLEASDEVVIEYSIGDAWQLVAQIDGNLVPTGNTVSGFRAENIPAGEDIQFRIILCTDDNSEKLSLNCGNNASSTDGLVVGTPFFAGSDTPYKPGNLPVTLISFYGLFENDKINLFWETLSESNNSHFELERTSNGEQFSTVTIVQGSGNSNNKISYMATDFEPFKGTTYYRLKQVDYDGKFEYSNLIAVNSNITDKDCNLVVKPNPCMGKCFVYLQDCAEQEGNIMTFSMYDALGNVVNSQTNMVQEGKSLFAIDVNSAMKPGVYIVRGNAGNKNVDSKAIITN